MLHENFVRFFEALPPDAHPMPVCAAAVGALATFYQQPETEQSLHDTVIRLIAKMPTIAAYSCKHSIGQPFMYPVNRHDYATNFLHMMFATPCESYEVDPVLAAGDRPAPDPPRRPRAELLDQHGADGGQLARQPVRQHLGRDQRAVGPLHGGANQQVIEMLESIAREEGSAQKFLTRAKDRGDTTRLMGFGHRVYKSYDPRAAILKQRLHRRASRGWASRASCSRSRWSSRSIALADDYFVSRKLYPNVDFYSGVIYKTLGIPVNMFTVMFTIGRLPGWIAQWLEMRRDPTSASRVRGRSTPVPASARTWGSRRGGRAPHASA